jgi:hypothetical protein
VAWSVVQSATAVLDGSATISKAFTTANVSAGNKILVAVSAYNAAATSVHDGASNAWTQIGAKQLSQCNVSLWALDVPAGDVGTKPTITATATGAGSVGIVIAEVSGLLAGNTTAMCDGALASISGTATGSTGSPAYSSAAANEYLVSVYGDDENATTTWTAPGAPWTALPGQNATFSENIALAYTNSTGGSETGAWSQTGGSDWAVLTVAFQLAPAGTDSGPNSPSTGTDLGGGTGSWTSPGNITADDGSAATWAVV